MKRLRVYLSSTFEDLKEYREKVFASLEKGGLDVVRMEAYAAADERPLNECLRDVAQSEVYIGIFAWRYGYEPPAEHGNPEAKSITELEYRKADSAKLRKLVFLVHPDTEAAWPDQFKDTKIGGGEGGEKLRRLRNELSREKTCAFFRTPDELATLVLASIMRSGLSGRIYNIPALSSGFVTRPELRNAIGKSLIGCGDRNSGANTVIQGEGGFGKTTLAIDACHQVAVVGSFPDGMLWTSLGENPDLRMILTDLYAVASEGSPLAVTGIEGIASALAETLEGRRCLVVIDDVWRADDLRPFLELHGTRLLVTTRIRTLVEEASQTDWLEVLVDEMKPGEAAAVLGRGLEVTPSAAEALQRLADLLGNFALLLDLVNARLREEHKSRGNLTECVAKVMNLLKGKGALGFDRPPVERAGHGRNNSLDRNTAVARSVEAGLKLAEQMFTGLAVKAAEVSIFPENIRIPTRVLADLWAIDALDIEEYVLRPLDNLSILRWDRVTGEAQIHMIVRRALQARVETTPGELAAVHRRLLDNWGDPHCLQHAYAWRWFGWHCTQAGEVSRLMSLLLEIEWLRAKLEATEINALIGDFDLVRGDREAELVQGALRLSAHALKREPRQLVSQLNGRLHWIQPQVRRMEEQWNNARTPWLRLLTPTLASPAEPLIQVFDEKNLLVQSRLLAVAASGTVVSGDSSGVRVWDLADGAERFVILPADVRPKEGYRDEVSAVVLSPDRSLVIVCFQRGALEIWSLAAGQLERTIAGPERPLSAAVTPDERYLIEGFRENLCVWDLTPGSIRYWLDRGAEVIATSLTGDAFVVDGRTIGIFDVETGLTKGELQCPGRLTAIAATPDGATVIVGGAWDSSPHILAYDVVSGHLLREFRGHTVNPDPYWRELSAHIKALAITPDGTTLLSAGGDDTVRVWNVASGDMEAVFDHRGPVALAILPDGHSAISAGYDDAVRVWRLSGLKAETRIQRHTGSVFAVALSPDGKWILSGGEDCIVRVWDAMTLEPVGVLEGHKRRIYAIAVTPDSRLAITAGLDHTIRVWKLPSGALDHTFEGHNYCVRGLAAMPDGRQIISAAEDALIGVWDLDRKERSKWIHGDGGELQALALTPDGQTVLVCDQGGFVRAIDLATGAHLFKMGRYGEPVLAVAVTPDGKQAVWGTSDGAIQVWSLQDRRQVCVLLGPARVLSVAVTTDRRVITGDTEGTIRVADLNTGMDIASFTGDSRSMITAVSPDGRTIVGGDSSGRVHMFQLA